MTTKKPIKKNSVTKKEYLQGMYKVLGKKFPLFKTMDTLVEKGNLSDGLVNKLTSMMQTSIKSVGDKINAEKLKESMQRYNQIKNIEHKEDLSFLDNQISLT